MMNTLKQIGDWTFGIIWSGSLIKLIPLSSSVGHVVLFPHLDRSLSIAISILGLAYGIARLVISIRKALQDERFREQEIIEKKNSNFKRKWNDEFNTPKDK